VQVEYKGYEKLSIVTRE